MADVNIESGGKGRKGRQRASKVSTKIDMTPMVDLAFLLITFFMLTTTFSKPQTMEVNVPAKKKDDKGMELKESNAMTVILGEKNKIYWYLGLQNPEVKVTDFSPEGIRKIIIEKKSANPELVVIIKPGELSRYKNLVDILDEIHLSETAIRYSIGKVSPHDLELIASI